MELDRAKEIVQALADGVDPYTGDRFPADGPYQRADTVRALYTILEALSSAPSASRREKPPRPVDPNKPRAGGKWTEEEEAKLREAFHARKPFDQIAKDHGRTPGAITARLVKLGLLEDNPSNRAGHGNRPPDAPPEPQPAPVDPEDCPF
jgi:hypothetical protein